MSIGYDEWVKTGQYPDGTPLNPKDKNKRDYYDNYKAEVKKAKDSGNDVHKKEIERQHGIIDTTTASEAEKKDYIEYVQTNPDLRERSEALGHTRQEMAEMGQKHYETFGVGQYIYDEAKGGATYEINKEKRANYLNQYAGVTVGDEGARQRKYEIAEKDFEAAIRGFAGGDNWLYDAGETSDLWRSRGLLDDDYGDDWTLANFKGEGWNFNRDNPYHRGILKDAIEVNEKIGHLRSEGDPRFAQDRYTDEFRANDYPEGWVDAQGNWHGPPQIEGYWNALRDATRNEAGDLRMPYDEPEGGWQNWLGGTSGRSGVGAGVAGMMYNTPYTQPAPQDWSNLRYQVAGSPASELAQMTDTPTSRAMFGNKGAAMQPWATGQGVPSGLLNYQIPGGPAANVTFSGGNPGLFDFNNIITDNNNSQQTVYNLPGGGTTTDFSTWQQAQHESLYPGRQEMANIMGGGGLNYFGQGGADFRSQVPSTSADWLSMYGNDGPVFGVDYNAEGILDPYANI